MNFPGSILLATSVVVAFVVLARVILTVINRNTTFFRELSASLLVIPPH